MVVLPSGAHLTSTHELEVTIVNGYWPTLPHLIKMFQLQVVMLVVILHCHLTMKTKSMTSALTQITVLMEA